MIPPAWPQSEHDVALIIDNFFAGTQAQLEAHLPDCGERTEALDCLEEARQFAQVAAEQIEPPAAEEAVQGVEPTVEPEPAPNEFVGPPHNMEETS